ncbi:MAG: hypothetical protein AB7I48_11415 [Planctomycetaceae bacterium]
MSVRSVGSAGRNGGLIVAPTSMAGTAGPTSLIISWTAIESATAKEHAASQRTLFE